MAVTIIGGVEGSRYDVNKMSTNAKKIVSFPPS